MGSTQPLTKISTRNLPERRGRSVRKADFLRNVRVSTYHNLIGLHGLLYGCLPYFTYTVNWTFLLTIQPMVRWVFLNYLHRIDLNTFQNKCLRITRKVRITFLTSSQTWRFTVDKISAVRPNGGSQSIIRKAPVCASIYVHLTSVRPSQAFLMQHYLCSHWIETYLRRWPCRWYVTDKTNKQTPWPLVRERTISTDRPPPVDEI
jgi:hypothetical protein